MIPQTKHSQQAPTVTLDKGLLVVRFPYDLKKVAAVKNIPGRRWNPDQKVWTVPANAVSAKALEEMGFVVPQAPATPAPNQCSDLNSFLDFSLCPLYSAFNGFGIKYKKRGKKMPTGVYPRSPKLKEQIKKNLAKGRDPAARAKATVTLKKIAQDEQWRMRVSEATKTAMHSPEVREKHLKGLKKAREKYGNNFRGGNGQETTEIVRVLEEALAPRGFIREFCIPTKSVRDAFENVPPAYKVDFGNPKTKKAIELDGACHRNIRQQELDKKKNAVLKALGWTVLRWRH